MVTRLAFRAAMRAAAVELLTDYRADVGLKLQIHPARPASIYPPTAFPERFVEEVTYSGHLHQRTPRLEVTVLHGLFDSLEAVNQADAFADGFLDWALDRYHAAGAATLVGVVGIEDIPVYVPDWIRPRRDELVPSYYATQITLEGFLASG